MNDYFKLSPDERYKVLTDLHYDQKLSMAEIAEKFGTYLNKLLRDAKTINFQKRSKSDVQREALLAGKRKHPTKGKPRSEATKAKISEGVGEKWDSLSDKERKQRSESGKEAWNALDDSKKIEIHQKANKAIRETTKSGSKLEHFLRETLTNQGYSLLFHMDHTLMNQKLQLDMLIPALGIVIEVDGPSHHQPIWGQQTLQKNNKADTQKNGLCLSMGLWVIRVKQTKRLSFRYLNDIGAKLLAKVKEIESGSIPKVRENMIIEVI
jgi:very-short-patch-repair endonuclease